MGWHCRRNILPSGKGVSLLGWCFGSNYSLTINNLLGFDDNLTDLEDGIIGIDRERTCHFYVVRRHGLGKILPTGEGVTLFYRSCFRSDGSAIFNLNALIVRAVYLISQFVLINGVGTNNHDIMGWHSCRNILPSGKGVSLLGRGLGSYDGLAIDYPLGLDDVIADLEDCIVGID